MRKLSLWDVSQVYSTEILVGDSLPSSPASLSPLPHPLPLLEASLGPCEDAPRVLISSASSFPCASASFAFGHLKVAPVALACVSWWYLGPGAQVGALPPPAGIFLCDIFAFCNIGSICSVVFDLAFGPSRLTR